MISLEQVRLLEVKINKAIDYVQRVNAENAALAAEKEGLQVKLNANQKRIDELEILVMQFKEDQGRIEDGVIAALDRLSQFEEAFENSLREKPHPANHPKAANAAHNPPVSSTSTSTEKKTSIKTKDKPESPLPTPPAEKEIFFEIAEAAEKEKSSNNKQPDLSLSDDPDIN